VVTPVTSFLRSVVVKRSNRLLILLGLLIAIGGALAAVAIAGSGGGGGTGTVPGRSCHADSWPVDRVVVASTKIAAGTVVDKSMVKTARARLPTIAALNGTTFSNGQRCHRQDRQHGYPAGPGRRVRSPANAGFRG